MGKLLEDQRPIERLILDGNSLSIIQGQGGIEAIFVCSVHGEMAAVPWFELLNKDGKVIERVNGKYVVKVVYL